MLYAVTMLDAAHTNADSFCSYRVLHSIFMAVLLPARKSSAQKVQYIMEQMTTISVCGALQCIDSHNCLA